MITQSEVYRLFERIDRTPGIMEPRIGRWHAWPAAKMQLVWHLMYEGADTSARRERFSLGQLTDRLTRSLSDIATAIRQTGSFREPGSVGMICAPRVYRCGDGAARDMIYGDVLHGAGLALPVQVLEHPVRSHAGLPPLPRPALQLQPYHAAAELLALALMATPRLRTAADALDSILEKAAFPLTSSLRRRKILLALALFEARRRVFQWLFGKAGLSALVLTYAPGRTGEIAAARELSIPVFELQHGVISAHCPDYAWPESYRAFKADMAVPGRIGLFGPMFAREIRRSGFWTDDETAAIGAAWTEFLGGKKPGTTHPDGPLRLVFMTQATNRLAAVAFWERFLAAAGAVPFRLSIKLHPEEANDAHAYESLVRAAPDRVTIAPATDNPIDLMLRSDIVLSYNSMSLIEALGLGTPSISLCGGSIPGGLAGTFNLPSLMDVMPHVETPDRLHQTLVERAASAEILARWREQALAIGRECFCDGFHAAAAGIVNQMAGAPG